MNHSLFRRRYRKSFLKPSHLLNVGYNRDFQLIAKKSSPGGKRPYSASFSPDGESIAVGFGDSTKVDVLSGRDLAYLYSPDTAGVSNGNLCSVAWSFDGSFLYASGMWDKNGDNPIRGWSKGGRGAYEDSLASSNTVLHILPLKSGGAAFGAADPAFGVIEENGRKRLYMEPAIADHRGNLEGFLVSWDASTVRFGFEVGGKRPALFSISSRILTTLSSESEGRGGLIPPVTGMSGMHISDWDDSTFPKLNGKPLELEKYERSRSLAMASDGKGFLLGTEWYLRFFDRSGSLKWKTPTPDVAWGVNISGDGRLAVATFGDGTIRWYRMQDGKEILAFFPHKDGKRWVLWTPSGYFASSSGADELIGWHKNNGKDRAPDFYPCSQFRSVYYRPDVAEKILSTLDEPSAVRLANEEAGKKAQEVSIQAMLPPIVTIQSPKDGTQVSDSRITLLYRVRSPSGEPITGVKVLVDGRPLSDERAIHKKQPTEVKEGQSIEMAVQIPEKNCNVSLIAENRYSASVPATVHLIWRGQKPAQEDYARPRLYVLAIGVGDYRKPELKLTFPGKDARDFASVMEVQKQKLYRDVVTKVLTDRSATKDGILGGLEWIEKEVTARDVAMVFLAGHGDNDRNGDYYFLPQDGDPESLKRTGVAHGVIKDTITNLPGKVIFFLDTCHSGNIMAGQRRGSMGDIDKLVNDLKAAENGVVVFASSTGKQYSLENEKWGNGAFTKALVEGLAGKADLNRKGAITITMLECYISDRVKELTQGKQTPTSAKPGTIPDFPIAVK